MKNLLIVLVIVALGLTSCGGSDSEKIANDYHEKLDNHEYQYIIDNMCDEDLLAASGTEGIIDFFELVESWGPIKNRSKDIGFSVKPNTDYTTSKLNYTFENDMGTMYEGLVLIDRGEGYKLLNIFMNTDKSIIDSQLAGF